MPVRGLSSAGIPPSPSTLVPLAGGVALPAMAVVPFAAAAAGAADDVTLLLVPFRLRVLDFWCDVTTLIALSTLTLRTAAAGAGTALSSDLVSAATAVVRTTLALSSASRIAEAGTTLYLRRSDRGVAGCAFLLFCKEPAA